MPACSSANVLGTEGLDRPDSVKEQELAPIPYKGAGAYLVALTLIESSATA